MTRNVLMLVSSLLCACQVPSTSGAVAERPLVLKTYDVPSAFTAEISSVVSRLLWAGKDKPPAGTVSVAPGGKLLVAAPDAFQAGVKDLVDTLRARPPSAPASVMTEAWIVMARPAPKALIGPGLGEISAVTDALLKQGPLEFVLAEKLSVMALSGAPGRTEGASAKMNVTATVMDTQVYLDLELKPEGPVGLNTRVQVPPGKMVVLGQAGYQPMRESSPFFDKENRNGTGMSLFYVVRTRVEGGTGQAP